MIQFLDDLDNMSPFSTHCSCPKHSIFDPEDDFLRSTINRALSSFNAGPFDDLDLKKLVRVRPSEWLIPRKLNSCHQSPFEEYCKRCPESDEEPQGFAIKVNTNDYAPNEVTVSIQDRDLIVSAKHESGDPESGDYVCKQLYRKFSIPQNIDADKITSSLTSAGTLSVTAPAITKRKELLASNITMIPVEVKKDDQIESQEAQQQPQITETMQS